MRLRWWCIYSSCCLDHGNVLVFLTFCDLGKSWLGVDLGRRCGDRLLLAFRHFVLAGRKNVCQE